VIQSEAINLAEQLVQKRWSMMISDRDTFVTSDKPVCIEHQTKTTFGFQTPGVIICFPVSPRRLLSWTTCIMKPQTSTTLSQPPRKERSTTVFGGTGVAS
jgi:hypothetical protein